ncbi:MAG: methionine gamma-lyase family protein [Eubacteriales bacterium]|nr:methionine gamma-lyase family protein [Eubacteriales bacterium]
MKIHESLLPLADEVQNSLTEVFRGFDRTAEINTCRVMEAFQEERVAEGCFAGTTGYGYDDLGRDTLDRIYARVFGAEAALVRLGLVNGTHALTCALFGLLGPGDLLLSVTGAPYDTLRTAIGISGEAHGSLAFYGVRYAQVELAADGGPDYEAVKEACTQLKPRAVLIQRSRGYADRRALTVHEIGELAKTVKEVSPSTAVMVDNCYGEFCETLEPTMVGADLMAGSLIKNPGGGLAPAGGYIAGRKEYVENASYRLTSPGVGGECGATFGQNRLLFQGFFMAPHVTAQALKTAAFCAGMLERLGYDTSPGSDEVRPDIIQMINLRTPENLQRFCRGIQHGSPVDSYVSPEPWAMPGYDCEVIMAAGAFVQGSSIELSCDGPLREPYTAYLQGGITYESGKLGVLTALTEMLDGK